MVTLHAQVKERSVPRLMKKDGRNALLVDDAPYLMLGAQVHNPSDWPAMPTKGWIRPRQTGQSVPRSQGVLKEERALRSFRLRGLVKAGIELTLACTAYNLTRMWRMAPRCTA